MKKKRSKIKREKNKELQTPVRTYFTSVFLINHTLCSWGSLSSRDISWPCNVYIFLRIMMWRLFEPIGDVEFLSLHNSLIRGRSLLQQWRRLHRSRWMTHLSAHLLLLHSFRSFFQSSRRWHHSWCYWATLLLKASIVGQHAAAAVTYYIFLLHWGRRRNCNRGRRRRRRGRGHRRRCWICLQHKRQHIVFYIIIFNGEK